MTPFEFGLKCAAELNAGLPNNEQMLYANPSVSGKATNVPNYELRRMALRTASPIAGAVMDASRGYSALHNRAMTAYDEARNARNLQAHIQNLGASPTGPVTAMEARRNTLSAGDVLRHAAGKQFPHAFSK